MKEMICIVCPRGCHLTVDENHDYQVTGNGCPRGEVYGKNELKNPTRTLTTTVAVLHGKQKRLPVKTKEPIPKSKLREAMKKLRSIRVEAPVHMHTVICTDICGSGVDVIAARTICRKGEET